MGAFLWLNTRNTDPILSFGLLKRTKVGHRYTDYRINGTPPNMSQACIIIIDLQKSHSFPLRDFFVITYRHQAIFHVVMNKSTCKRNLKSGRLYPICLHSVDEYLEEDIRMALEESRRRGRISLCLHSGGEFLFE